MAGAGTHRYPKVKTHFWVPRNNNQNGNGGRELPMRKKLKKIGVFLLFLLSIFIVLWMVDNLFPRVEGYQTTLTSEVSSLPSSPICYSVSQSTGHGGNNELIQCFVHDLTPFQSCIGLETRLPPDFFGEKLGLLNSRNSSIESLDDKLFDEILLRVGDKYTTGWFYISLGKDDYYTHLFQHEISGARRKYSGRAFTDIQLKQMIRVVKNLHNANARKIVCMEIVPLGCSPIALWESYNSTANPTNQTSAINLTYCAEDIDELVLQYNSMLSAGPLELNDQVYQGIAEYGFCSLMGEMRVGGGGRSGGVIGIWMCFR